MFELIRALDERVVALGGSGYSWYVANNPPTYQRTNVVIGDLENLYCVGRTSGGVAGSNLAYRNMVLITDRIKGLINTGRFMTTSGGTTAYTVASMETAIGASLDYPTKVNEARWWQACQDALDLMVNAYTLMSPTIDSGAGYYGIDRSLFPDPTVQSAWDNRTDNTLTGIRVQNSVRWSMSYEPVPPDGYEATVQYEVSGHFLTNQFDPTSDVIHGTLVDANYIYDAGAQNADYIGGSVYAELNGNSIDITDTANDEKITATPTLGAQITYFIEITTTEPSTVPFDTDTTQSSISLSAPALEVWHDLTSYLTDQA
jgi:hypothetical protein